MNSIKNKKKKKKSFKKMFNGFCCRKLNMRKLDQKKMMQINNGKTYFTLDVTSKTRYVA